MTPLCVPDTEAAKLFCMGRSTFREHVSKGVLPQPIKVGGLTRWRVADLQAYVSEAEPQTAAMENSNSFAERLRCL